MTYKNTVTKDFFDEEWQAIIPYKKYFRKENMRKILSRYKLFFSILICVLAVINLFILFNYSGSLLAFVVSDLLGIVSVLSLFGLNYKKSSHKGLIVLNGISEK